MSDETTTEQTPEEIEAAKKAAEVTTPEAEEAPAEEAAHSEHAA